MTHPADDEGAPPRTRDRYGVIGHPIAHSLSPVIHRIFAAQTHQSLGYIAIDSAPGAFEHDVAALFADGVRGLNVTVPHKVRALALCDETTQRARTAGAVNTLARRDDGSVLGDTTDGAGLVRDLVDNLGLVLRGSHILVLGAGGTVFSVLGDLLAQGPGGIVIANRTPATARRAARAFAKLGNVHGCGLDDIPAQPYDLVINATSATLKGSVPAISPGHLRGAHGYDLMYAANGTLFTAWCDEHGAASVHTGIGMLVEQAALSFEIWRGVRPETLPVRRVLAARYGFTF